MTFSKFDASLLSPIFDELESPIESPSNYARRVQKLLPNFPESVITQWFYDHHHCIEQYRWLDYASLNFTLVTVSAEFLGLPCLLEHETVVQYRNYFLQGTDSPRMDRLAKYIESNGTWPAPPIILDNSEHALVSPWGLRYSTPYDLIEGHHRMAVLYGLGRHRCRKHKVWLLQRPSVSTALEKNKSR